MINILLTILFSSVKFAMTFPVAVMQFEFSFFETILWTNMGGILGIYFLASCSPFRLGRSFWSGITDLPKQNSSI